MVYAVVSGGVETWEYQKYQLTGCLFRTSVRSAGTHSQSLVLTDSAGSELWRTDGCISESIYLDSGQSYAVDFQTTSKLMIPWRYGFLCNIVSALLLNEDGTALVGSESTMDLERCLPCT